MRTTSTAVILAAGLTLMSAVSASAGDAGQVIGPALNLLNTIISNAPKQPQPQQARPHRQPESSRPATGTRAAAPAEPAEPAAAPEDPAAAVAWYREKVARKPNDSGLHIALGEAYLRLGDSDMAAAEFADAVRLNAKSDKARVARGGLLLGRKDYDGALADAIEAIRLNDKSAPAYLLRGRVRLAQGRAAEAASDFVQVVRLDPKSADGHVGRGLAALKGGDPAGAIGFFNEAIKVDPQSVAAYRGRAAAFEAKGEYGPALSDAEVALARQPDDADAREVKARINARMMQTTQPMQVAAAQPASSPGTSTAPVALSAGQPVVATLTAVPTPAGTDATQPAAGQPPLRRVALVIGNGAYEGGAALANAGRDADLVGSTLKQIGFDSVTIEKNLTLEAFDNVLKAFEAVAAEADVAMVYFAGHGIQVDKGANYLIPVDSKPRAVRDLKRQAIDAADVAKAIERARALRIVVLDACRDNPFEMQMASRSLGRGLSLIEPGSGEIIAYAARAGSTAADGTGRQNGPYAESFAKRLVQKPVIEVRRLFDLVRDDVKSATGDRQEPAVYGSVPGSRDFFLAAR